MADTIEMPFGTKARVGQGNNVLGGSQDPPGERAIMADCFRSSQALSKKWLATTILDFLKFNVLMDAGGQHTSPCQISSKLVKRLQTTTHYTCLTALCPGLPRWASTRKVKPIWILLKQETVSGSGISCTLLQTDNHASTPPLSFLQARCPSWCPTNSIKALKAQSRSSFDNM